jgi:hypothetical protein
MVVITRSPRRTNLPGEVEEIEALREQLRPKTARGSRMGLDRCGGSRSA